MKQLYILRHGVAESQPAPGCTDDDRELTAVGEKRMGQVGRGLRRLDLKLDRIVTSPLPRARRTAQIVAEVLGLTELLEVSEELRADRDAGSIQKWLETREESTLMIVGHNPSLSDLVSLLISDAPGSARVVLRKGGIAALSSRAVGSMELDWFARPLLFRRLGGGD